MILSICHLRLQDGPMPSREEAEQAVGVLAHAGLPQDECARLLAIQSDEACVQSVGARLALLWALVDGKHAAHRLDEIPWEDDLTPQVRNIMAAFDRSEMGQPRLIGCPRSVSFAHSADLAACATDTSALVGVDIESLNRCPACEARIATRYFSEREQARIAASTDPHLAFLRIWTRKEALGKARGTGLAAKSHLLDTEALSSDCFVEWQVSGHLITACIIAE